MKKHKNPAWLRTEKNFHRCHFDITPNDECRKGLTKCNERVPYENDALNEASVKSSRSFEVYPSHPSINQSSLCHNYTDAVAACIQLSAAVENDNTEMYI